jgi:hypothetical protein
MRNRRGTKSKATVHFGPTKLSETYAKFLAGKGVPDLEVAVHALLNIGFRWVFPEREAQLSLGRALRRLKLGTEGTLAKSRRAREFFELVNSSQGKIALSTAITAAGVALTVDELLRIAEAAAAGDDKALKRLQSEAAVLVKFVLDSRGRPISRETSFHAYLLLLLHHSGTPSRYSRGNGVETADYFDSATLATREAWNEPRFDPRGAIRMMKERVRYNGDPWFHAVRNPQLTFAPRRSVAKRVTTPPKAA